MANYLKIALALTVALVASTTPALAGELVIGAIIAVVDAASAAVASISVGTVVGALVSTPVGRGLVLTVAK